MHDICTTGNVQQQHLNSLCLQCGTLRGRIEINDQAPEQPVLKVTYSTRRIGDGRKRSSTWTACAQSDILYTEDWGWT